MNVASKDESVCLGKANVIIGTEMMNSCSEATMEGWMDLLQETSSVN